MTTSVRLSVVIRLYGLIVKLWEEERLEEKAKVNKEVKLFNFFLVKKEEERIKGKKKLKII